MPDSSTLRQSIRPMRARPMFAAAVIGLLGLGIGATTAMFSVVKGTLLSPLPYPDASSIVRIAKNDTTGGWAHYPVLYRELEVWRNAESFEKMGALRYSGASSGAITVNDAHRIVRLLDVTTSYFDVLGVPALLGRTFVPEDEDVGSSPNVVVSHRTWQNLFLADPEIVGRTFRVPGSALTYHVVGVLPPGVDYPAGTDFYVPEITLSASGGERMHEVDVLARLAPGVSRSDVRSELLALRAPLTREDPLRYGEMDVTVSPLIETIVGEVEHALWLLFGAVAGVLLIVAANVASLLFVRGAERDRELAIRVAMGAGRIRLTLHLVMETLLLAMVGGAVGLLVAKWGVASLLAIAPDALPRSESIELDGSVLTFAFVTTVVAALAASLAPAWKASRQDAMTTLRRGRGVFADWRAMSLLVVFELSLAFVLVVGAGLLGRAFLAQSRIDRGFVREGLTFAALQVPSDKYPMFGDFGPRIELFDRLMERIQAIPGVRDVTVVQYPPGSADAGVTGPMSVEGQTEEDRKRNPMVSIEWVPESYFETLGMTLHRGRGFESADRGDRRRVAIVTESFAEHHWPGEDALGKRLGSPTMPFATVVGVVADVRYRELRKSWLDVYFPVGQTFSGEPGSGYFGGRHLVVKSSHDTDTLAPALRAAVHDVDADIPVEAVLPLTSILNEEVARPRFQAIMLGLFAGTGLLLAAVGIYGVMATVTAARTPEIGVRIALGATPGEAVGVVWKRGALITAVGLGVGVAAAATTTRLMANLLYDVSPLDRGSFSLAIAFLTVTALTACYLPARRAARIDPATTLRHE